jgi:CRP/FNR family transcriptional regulator, nitrogen oxide reductase regulator
MSERRRSPLEPVAVSPFHCTPVQLRRILGGTPFFAPLAAEDINRLADRFRQTHFQAGDTIVRAGDPATKLAIVAAGLVKLYRPTADGQDVVVNILKSGDYFGSLADLGNETYAETATAQTDCCILLVTAGEFREVLERYPVVALATLELVADRLRNAHAVIEQLSAYPVERRLASTLLTLAERIGRADGTRILIEMPLSRQDLADMTGAKVETVSRTMSDFRRSGLIDSGRRWIAITDAERLTGIAGGEPV